MACLDSDEDSSSDYVPSSDEDCRDENAESEEEVGEEEEGDEDMRMKKVFERYEDEKGADCSEDEEQEDEIVVRNDLKWWKSSEDKHRREKRCHEDNGVYRKRYWCPIDKRAHHETRKNLRQEKTRYHVYKFVLAGLMAVYLIQFALVDSASLWAFSMVKWRHSVNERNEWKDDLISHARMNSNGHSDESSRLTAHSSQTQIPDYVRSSLYLCATLSRRVIKSEHDATVTQHALRACDIAVKLAPNHSHEAIEAHVLRGDLLSLILRFHNADEDYKAAMAMLESSGTNPQVALDLFQDVNLKKLANHWTLLYKTKRFKELRREAKARAVHAKHDIGKDYRARLASELAADWLRAFKQEKSVLEALTLQRSYTLRRLGYKALDGDCRGSKHGVA
ncbi:unnamed protein product [Peronospora belbahrii]|uniref:Uncharacterized protein n=1 Tax=Peronospora belbahrii TaxID=622444 RepID=A0AAU9KM67_9STRA|nr:unnamed protein product [Peronospora belbahrii]CAH0515600.1 unnamed protein product [Peronospora belbahrii]